MTKPVILILGHDQEFIDAVFKHVQHKYDIGVYNGYGTEVVRDKAINVTTVVRKQVANKMQNDVLREIIEAGSDLERMRHKIQARRAAVLEDKKIHVRKHNYPWYVTTGRATR